MSNICDWRIIVNCTNAVGDSGDCKLFRVKQHIQRTEHRQTMLTYMTSCFGDELVYSTRQ